MTGARLAGLRSAGVFALLWGLLAALNPTTTYHLAPALVVGGHLAAVWQQAAPQRPTTALADAASATALAAVAGLVLDGMGWLDGAVLAGSSALAEAEIVAVLSGLLAAVVGAVWATRSSSGQARRKSIGP